MNAKSGDRSYKRSWKNLLINKRYQLRFTLFMVGLSSLLMVGLGIWVMKVANETTEVSMTSVRGDACPKVPVIGSGTPTGEDEAAIPRPSMRLDESLTGSADAAANEPAPSIADAPVAAPGAGSAEPAAPAAGSAEPAAGSAEPGAPAAGSAEPVGSAGSADPATDPAADADRRVQVQIDESSMTLTVTLPQDYAEQVVKHWTCELLQAGRFDRLERGRLRILWAMILTGIVLVLGLAVYGIKMTHRVAGPLFKVSLYLSKMRDGRYDKVYNLRKGDQLVDFYDHFKIAHGGIVTMQRDDIARITEVIAAAEAAGAGQHPAVAELRALLARKEKSIE